MMDALDGIFATTDDPYAHRLWLWPYSHGPSTENRVRSSPLNHPSYSQAIDVYTHIGYRRSAKTFSPSPTLFIDEHALYVCRGIFYSNGIS